MTFDIVMDSQRFRALTTAQGPFVSVYHDDSRNTSDAEGHLVAIWRDLRKQLEKAGADDEMIATVLQAVVQGEPAVGGRAVPSSGQGTRC
jgi:hypothetical protein